MPTPDASQPLADLLARASEDLDLTGGVRQRGVVRRVGDGVARIAGLSRVGYEELIAFDSGALGMAYDVAEDGVGAILLSGAALVQSGDGARGLGLLPEVPVGAGVLGRIVGPLGDPLDDGAALPLRPALPLFRPSPRIIERKAVDQPLWTGVLAVDAAVPIGRGQRELIIGDRNVGKTALAVDVVAAQRPGDVTCVYAVIGQPMSRVLSLRRVLREAGCWENTVLVVADASAAPGLQYLAPYAATSIAESFRDAGGHALVVYDDLTKHADAYRELALLLGRPPGREAYPGDVFYIHGELLERAAARREDAGGGSVTALPLIETTEGDIASYIPTNLISITDGQVYLDTARFERDQRPAIDVGRSVSRIGSVAQPPLMRGAARNLRILLSRAESMESLTRVGLEMDVGMRETVERGHLLSGLLRQDRFTRRTLAESVIAIEAVERGWLTGMPPERARDWWSETLARVRRDAPELLARLDSGEDLEDGWQESLAPIAREARARVEGQPA